MNRLPFTTGEGKVYPAFTKFNRKVDVEQGDTVVQGRFGQSIHLGSDENFVKPFIKLTVGQSQDTSSLIAKKSIKGFPHVSEINLDESSIWVTTNGHIPLKSAAPSAMKPAHLGGKLSSVIAMNSDSIALNAKGLGNTDKKPYSPGGDIHAYAARNINLAAKTSINLETAYGTIHLGAGLGIADNPMVKGKELNDFSSIFNSSLAGIGINHTINIKDTFALYKSGFIQGNLDESKMILDQSQLIEDMKYFCEEMKSIENLEGWICSLGHGINKLTPEKNVHLFIETIRKNFS